MTPQQSVVYWTEYVIQNDGASHLRTLGSELYLYQYLLIDVMLYALVILIAFLYLSYILFKKIKFYFNYFYGVPETYINKKLS